MVTETHLVQVAQRAEDLDRAEAFYTKLLRAEPLARFDSPGLLFYRVGTVRLLLERAAPSCLLYLNIEDLRGRVEQLRFQGVAVEGEPHVIFRHDDDALGPTGTDEWQAFIRDSEGNLVGLVEHLPSER